MAYFVVVGFVNPKVYGFVTRKGGVVSNVLDSSLNMGSNVSGSVNPKGTDY